MEELIKKLNSQKNHKEFDLESIEEEILGTLSKIEELVSDIRTGKRMTENAEILQRRAGDLLILAVRHDDIDNELRSINKLLAIGTEEGGN